MSAVSRLLTLATRRTAASAPASSDPVKTIFLEKLKEYQQKHAVDHKTRVIRVLEERAKARGSTGASGTASKQWCVLVVICGGSGASLVSFLPVFPNRTARIQRTPTTLAAEP